MNTREFKKLTDDVLEVKDTRIRVVHRSRQEIVDKIASIETLLVQLNQMLAELDMVDPDR